MLIEPVEILLDKPRKILINKRALLKAETQINSIRGTGAFGRVGIDYLMLSHGNLLTFLKTPFPLDMRAALLWASLVPEEVRDAKGNVKRQEIGFDQVLDLLDQSKTPDGDIDAVIFKQWTDQAGNTLTREPPKEGAEEGAEEKKTQDQETGTGSGALPASSLN